MYRTHTCGELRLSDKDKIVTLCGWVQRSRKMGKMTFVDLRDRYGITQLVFSEDHDTAIFEKANSLGREYVIQVKGKVDERSSKNKNIPTGDIEITVEELNVLNKSEIPPFTIEDNTDGGDDLRMRYRYLDLRRNAVRKNLELRHKMTIEVRQYLDSLGFIEVETPVLIGSTPEGARDFVVPSRMNPGQFYALPQSPQTLKQLLMVSGFDRYFQIAKCFRDEDLRADRQPEFTQIDCEMSFVEQEDIINIFEGMAKHLFKKIKGIEFTEPFQRITWADAMKYYGRYRLCEKMGKLMAHELLPTGFFEGIDGIVPVPLHKSRLRERGYNQSALLAKGLSGELKIPVWEKALVRMRNNATQTHKSAFERWQNADRLFQPAKDACRLEGKHVLLVDDVLTTGATLVACADALSEIKDIRISVITLAWAK